MLTAKHNLDDIAWKFLQVGGRHVAASGDAVRSAALHPTEDIAVIDLKTDAAAALKPWALSVSDIGGDDQLDPDRDAVKMAGFVSEWSKVGTIPATANAWIGFTSVCYGTVLGDPPRDSRGQLRVIWGEREIDGGRSVKMPHPRGMSGGGLWRLVRSPMDVLWNPRTSAKLIGVPTGWNRVDIEFVVPVSKWHSWLLDTVTLGGLGTE